MRTDSDFEHTLCGCADFRISYFRFIGFRETFVFRNPKNGILRR